MHDDSRARIARLAAARNGELDVTASSAAIECYLVAVGAAPRAIEWGADVVDALGRVGARVQPLGVTPEALRDPRVREAHVEAQRRSFPDGDLARLAAARWQEALVAARAVARNLAWDAATARWVATLGPDRFASTDIGALGTRVPSHAVDAQLFAVGWAAWPDVAAGRDTSWPRLAEPLSDAYLAGAQRFWVLSDVVVAAPRIALDG